MSKFTVVHEINCNVADFWKLFFDKETQEKFHREFLGYPEYSVVEQNTTGTRITRKILAQPKQDLPGPIIKLLGSGFRYIEEGSFDTATSVWNARQTPSTLSDKLRLEYTLRIEPKGSDKVNRIIEYVCEAQIFGVGGLMEASLEKSVRTEFDQSAVFLNRKVSSPR